MTSQQLVLRAPQRRPCAPRLTQPPAPLTARRWVVPNQGVSVRVSVSRRATPQARERMGSPTLQTLQDSILLTPWLCFRGGGLPNPCSASRPRSKGGLTAGERAPRRRRAIDGSAWSQPSTSPAAAHARRERRVRAATGDGESRPATLTREDFVRRQKQRTLAEVAQVRPSLPLLGGEASCVYAPMQEEQARAAERRHATGRERINTPTLWTLQASILLLPWWRLSKP
jgi:hypothetical protein